MAKVEPTLTLRRRGRPRGRRLRRGARRRRARRVEETGATLRSTPFEDERVIAGQGTIGLELAEQVPDARDAC